MSHIWALISLMASLEASFPPKSPETVWFMLCLNEGWLSGGLGIRD